MVSKLLPSGDSEGFGITFLEANVCGCPVIGSKSGGIVDAIEHEVSGLLVEENDLDSICNAINRIIKDKSLRESTGRTHGIKFRIIPPNKAKIKNFIVRAPLASFILDTSIRIS